MASAAAMCQPCAVGGQRAGGTGRRRSGSGEFVIVFRPSRGRQGVAEGEIAAGRGDSGTSSLEEREQYSLFWTWRGMCGRLSACWSGKTGTL